MFHQRSLKSKTVRVWLGVIAVSLLFGVFATLTWHTVALAQEQPETEVGHLCGQEADQIQVSVASPSQQVSLKPGEGEKLQLIIPFHRARGYRTEEFKLSYVGASAPDPEAFPPGSRLVLAFTVIRRDSDELEENPQDHIVYYAFSTRGGVEGKLCFTADGVQPGRYQTTVQLADPNLTHTPIPLIITIQENNLVLMSGILVAAIAAGTAVMFFQSRFATKAASGIQHTFREWFRINWFGLGAGIAAAWAIWNSQYLRVESFGAAGVDYIALLAACAVAFTGAGVTGSLGQQGVMSGQGQRSTQTDTGKGSDSGGE